MSMSKRNIALAIVLILVAAGVAVVARGPMRNSVSSATGTTTATAQPQAERRWLAVAPGKVEPPSGIIKVTASTIGVVSKVLIKVNDTVFAGEPLILLNDDEIQARYMSAEAQAAMRRRLRDEQAAGKAGDRRRAEDAVADAETAAFDAQNAVDRAAVAWRSAGGPTADLTQARSELVRAREEYSKRQAQLRGIDAPLPTPNEAQVITARGDLALARVNLEKLRIRAPIDGTVLQININPGELAAPSALQPLLLVANLSTLNVRAELDERDLSSVKLGQKVAIRAAAFTDREFAGTVTSIAPLVEPSRLGSREPGNRSDVDAVEVVVKLTQPGPLTTGMKVDVYFSPDNAAENKPAK
jgi:HlyD family secretion protein